MNKSILLNNLIVTDTQSVIHSHKVEVFIEKGKATVFELGKAPKASEVIDCQGGMLTRGFTDLHFNLPDPGFEDRETFESAEQLALASGFVRLCCTPDTFPVLQTKSQVKYVTNKSQQASMDFLPLGALSKNLDGKTMTELFDMHQSGAVAFSNGERPIKDSGLLLRNLQYVQNFKGLVYSFPLDTDFVQGSMMHEGESSVKLGLKGIPDISEELIIKRDLDVLRYSGGKIHFTGISTSGAVLLIKQAKAEGLSVTCDTPIMNLVFTDSDLEQFEGNFKVLPPIRSLSHQKALWKGVKEGVIDAISSFHKPLNPEIKEVEFAYTPYGAITLQSLWPKLLEFAKQYQVDAAELAQRLTNGPEKILNIKELSIGLGEILNFTVTAQKSWTLSEENNLSLSKNNPFFNQEHLYKILASFSKNNLNLF